MIAADIKTLKTISVRKGYPAYLEGGEKEMRRRKRRLNPKLVTIFEGAAMIAGMFIFAWLVAAI
jgi:hypothetical protein